MSNVRHAALDYYATPGAQTSAGPYAATLEGLPATLADLCAVVQGLLIHTSEAPLYGVRLGRGSRQDVQLRSAEQLLARILELDPRPLHEARPPELRLASTCRDFATLCCALLRHRGTPARVRVGFAAYLGRQGAYVDHWVCERWHDEQRRWVLFDPQIDHVMRQAYDLDFDPNELSRELFVCAGDAWLRCRRREEDPRRFLYQGRHRGLPAIRINLHQDLAALNKVELQPWDRWWHEDEAPSAHELARLDRLAELSLAGLERFAELRPTYQQDPRLRELVETELSRAWPAGAASGLFNHWQNEGASGRFDQEIDRSDGPPGRLQDEAASTPAVRSDGPPGHPQAREGAAHHDSHLATSVDVEAPQSLAGKGSGRLGQTSQTLRRARPARDRGLLRLEPDSIVIRGARQHNLRQVDLTLPRNKLVVITGVSGSGKSSLAFDTIYAEGQRRYVESMSPYARQFIEQMEKPKVDLIAGLSPTIAIEQKTVSKNPRSSVGTITEVIHYLRLLYSRVGIFHCLSCGAAVEPQSQSRRCPRCDSMLPHIPAQIFSPNTPFGMCPDCQGLGARLQVDPALIVQDETLPLPDGALRWYGNLRKKKSNGWHLDQLRSLAAHFGADLELPWRELPEQLRQVVLFGSGQERIQFKHTNENGNWSGESRRPFAGVVSDIGRLMRQTQSDTARRWYASFMGQRPCEACEGERLRPEARAVTLGGYTIGQLGRLPLDQLAAWAEALYERLPADLFVIAEEALDEVRARVQFMLDVGLHYLTLDRPAPSLSGGEGQRIRLASQLGSGLVGVLYVLDEPSIGLHARDQETLLATLAQLRDQGNGVLVVEHDAETMRRADWLVDMGPGAGVLGGQVIAAGTPAEVQANPASLTGRYLAGELAVRTADQRRRAFERGHLTLAGARLHNLRNITVEIPLGCLTVVTGVSGSGKSSLITRTLEPALARALHDDQSSPGAYDSLSGVEQLDAVVTITQAPIGRSPRSNPATYTGLFDEIRALFAATPEAQARGYRQDRFSFNVDAGRCAACKGQGQKKVEMHFMADVWVTCRECGGLRFDAATLEVRYQGKHIAEVLDMDIQEALDFFAATPALARGLRTLHDVGLGYLKLGQSATTLSGGEAQRLKLARELGGSQRQRVLYILDEPTTGLHFADIQRLVDVLHSLVQAGHSVVVIEHNLDIIMCADWLIDLGPNGGAGGGAVVATGTPEQVAQVAASRTGQFIASRL